jgi:uncharacterized GH25 family protein
MMLVLTTTAFAYEISIMTDPEGSVGQEQVINVNWGAFGLFLDPRSSYFDSIIQGELWVLAPNGQRINLELEEMTDRYVSRFTPRIGGDHQVIFYHNRGIIDAQHGEPKGWQNIEVIAKTFIDVEDDEEIEAWDQVAGLPLEIKALTDVSHLHVGGEVKGQLLFFSELLAGASLNIYAPGGQYDVPLELTTDQNGEFTFTADQEGAWQIKTSYVDDSVREVDGQEVIGARYNFTMVVTSHDHGEYSAQVVSSGNTGMIHTLYLLTGLLFAGAGYMFGRSKSAA